MNSLAINQTIDGTVFECLEGCIMSVLFEFVPTGITKIKQVFL